VSDWVVDFSGRGISDIANKDASPRFGGELKMLGGVDVNKGGATKDSESREFRIAASERGERDDTSSIGPGTVSDVDHGQEGESPKAIGKRRERRRALAESANVSHCRSIRASCQRA
jgi:hypothetical protein